jgi:hypothetical protein
MSTWRRPLLVAFTLGAAIVLLFASALSMRGALEGSVMLVGGCGGDPPKGVPCIATEAPVEGATVVISSSNDVALSARTDNRGRYSLTLPAGTYMVAAWARFLGPAPGTVFHPVRITGGGTSRLDIYFSSPVV